MDARPLGIITGTGLIKGWISALAYSAYTRKTDHAVFSIHRQGLDRLETGYQGTAAEVLAWAGGQDRKVVLIGHSQGALHALRMGLEHPDLIDHVVLLCGPLDGTRMADLMPGWLRPFIERAVPVVTDLHWHSDYCSQLRWQAEHEWPAEVKVTMVSVKGDVFVRPRRSAIALDLPPQTALPFYVGRRRPRHLPLNVQHVSAPLAGHLTSLIHPAVLSVVRRRLQADSQLEAA